MLGANRRYFHTDVGVGQMNRTRAIAEMLLLFLTFFLPGFIAQAFGASPGPATTLVMLQSIITGVPQLLLIAYVAGVTGPFSSPQWGCSRMVARDVFRLALLVVASFAVIAPFAALTTILPREWTAALTAGYRWGLQGIVQLPLALLFCLTAGYREELFFRAYLIGRMEEIGTPLSVAVAISTVLFCLGHAYEGPLGIALAASLGVLFATVFAKRRNLHIIAIAHGLYNFVVLVVSLLIQRALPAAFSLDIFNH